MLSALSPAATRQAATMLSALSPVVGCPELGGATPCFVCGGGVIETVLMVIAAVPLVGVGDAAMDPVAPVVEETNFSLSDLGVKPMISRPAINVEAIAISKGSCSTHTEKEPNENLSSGSDNDDIAVLTRKYKSLKWKYNDLKEFVANAKKSRANANKPPDHGAVNSVYKSLLNQHIHSPSLDGKSKADVIEKTDHGAVKVGIASALEHFHELQSKHFTSSLQELANVFVNLFPNKSIIDPPTSPARNQANVIEGEHISNNNNEEHSKSKSEVQSGTSKPKWDPSPIYDKSQKDLNTISSAAQGSIQQQAKSDQLESPPDLQEFFVDCTQRHKTTKITPAAPPPIGFATPKPRFDRTPIYSKPQNNLHVESTACQGHIEEVQAKEQLDPSFHSQGDSLQAEGNNSPDIECIGHYIPNNLASLEAPSFSLGLDDLEIEGHNEQAPAQLEKNCKPVPQVFNNTSPFQNNDNRQVLLASHSLLEGTHCTNKSPPIQKIVGTPIAVVSTTNKIIDLVTPEALVLSRKSFDRICIDVCIEAERLYNQRRSEENNGIFARNHTSAENVPFYMTPNRVLQPLDPNINYEANNRGTPGSSTCKVAAYGKRRQVVGSKFTTYPYVSGNNRFFVSRIDKAYYDAVISMSTGHSGRLKAIRLTHEEFPHVRFSSLGQSLKPNGKVENFVINSFCRLLFLDHHPKMSKKHYFFNRVGAHFLSSANDFNCCNVEHEFRCAHGVKTL